MATHAKRLISLVLTLAILMGLAVPSMAANGNAEATTPSSALSITPTENVALPTIGEISEELTADAIDFSKTVRVSIMLEGDSTLQAGYSTEAIAANASAMSYRKKLEQEQTRLISTIEQQVLHGQKLDVVWNLTLAANLISANIKRSEIDAIAALSGVKQVIEEECYAPMDTEAGSTPQMESSSMMTGANLVWAQGYTGAGSRVAIIDTGLDLNHQSFSSDGLLYSLSANAEEAGMSEEEYLASLALLDEAEISSVQDQLNVSIDINESYRGAKVPFTYNYIDQNYRVSHDFDTQGEHGSHVAGISAANTYIKTGSEYVNAREAVGVCGVAPDAQLIIMKVFGENGGAYTSDYMAAIEDAIVLGADSINLSLGSSSAGFTYASGYENIMQSLMETDTVVTVSAGNSYGWAESAPQYYLYKEDVRFATNGSPGSYSTALTVASVNSVSLNGDGSYTEPSYFTMSNFSSWGIPESLELKPEVTAPGGNIFSVNGLIGDGKQYELMSGTSMAAPQMAGMAAVMAQYIRENELEDVSGLTNRQLATSLLMSTSQPLKDYNGLYYSVMRQGSGMALVGDAVAANSFIKMDKNATAYAADGKVKAELGEDAEKSGVYSFSFTVNNLTGQAANYRLSTDLFTQALRGSYLDYATAALDASLVYTVNGSTYVPYVVDFSCDLNNDGVTDAHDAKVILAAVLDGTTAALPAVADVNSDGSVDTYDAHLILSNLVSGSFELPANGKTSVTVTATLTDEQKATLNASYPNGAYIEGFTYVESADGTDVTHSIPILGFYGNWSDPGMFGVSYTETLYGDSRTPYFGDSKNNNLVVKSATTDASYLHTGNPYLVEDSYPADRAAVNSADLLSQYKLGLLRNAAAMRLQILDNDSNQLYSSGVKTYVNGAYNSNGTWKGTSTNYTINVTPASLGLAEGDRFTVEVTAIPEYYALRQELTEESFEALVRSGVLGDGSTISVELMIDDTAPVLSNATLNADETELLVSCSDNYYVAAILVTDLNGKVLTSVLPEQASANESISQTISLEGIGGKCLLAVCDYAGNQATYELELAEIDDGSSSVQQTANVFMYESVDNVWHQLECDSDKTVTYSPTPIPATSKTIMAAEYVDGYVYQADTSNHLYVAPQSSPAELTELADLSKVTNVQDMAFNTKDKQLYLLGSNNTIYTVNLVTGELTKQFTVSIVHKKDGTSGTDTLMGLAIDNNGNFIVTNYGGGGLDFSTWAFIDPIISFFVFTLDQVVDGTVKNLEPFQFDSGEYIYNSNGYTDKSASLTYDAASDRLFYNNCGGSFMSDFCTLYTINLDKTLSNDTAFQQWPAYLNYSYMALYSLNSSEGAIPVSTQPTSLTLSSTVLSMTAGDTAALTYQIGPWNLQNKQVRWSSSAEAVATVADGVITAVSQGTTVITAASVADPTMSASCTVTVAQPGPLPTSVAFQGLIFGDDSKTYWSEFTSDNTESWSAVHPASLYFYGGALSNNEIIAHNGEMVYAVDPDNFEAEELFNLSTVAYWNDSAPAEGFDAITVLNNNGTRFGVLDAHAGTVAYIELSEQFGSDHMANVALYNTHSKNGFPAYDYYVLTEGGKLYTFTLSAHDNSGEPAYDLEYSYLGLSSLKQSGVSSGKDGASSSMIYDEESGYLFVSTYTTGDYAYLYAIWPTTGTTTQLGNFGSGVWPVNSLYHYDTIEELTLKLKETELQLFKGDEHTVKATVLPLSLTGGVTMQSDNTSVVEVQGSTLIAVAPGSANVTVTTVDTDANGSRSKTIHVTVLDTVEISTSLNAMVTTKNDHFYWSKLNTESLREYEILSESTQRIVSGGAHNGKLYVNDGTVSMQWGFLPIGYPLMIDPLNDFDATAGASSDQALMPTDLTTLPQLRTEDPESVEDAEAIIGDYPLNLTSGDLLVLMDFEGGASLYWGFDINELGGHPGALAYDKRVNYVDEINGGTHDAHSYYLLTDTGLLYHMYIYGVLQEDPFSGGLAEGYYKYTSLIGDVGMTFADYTDMSMIPFNEGNVNGLIVSSANGLYFIDLSGETITSGKIGCIPDAAHISVLYSDAEIGEATTQSIETVYGSNAVMAAPIEDAQPDDTSWVYTRYDAEPAEKVADGALNAVAPKAEITAIQSDSQANTETVTLTLTETLDVTNGLIKVSYDPSILTFDALSSGMQANGYRVDEESGIISFAYASAKAAPAGKALASVRFTHDLGKGILDTTITLDTLQRNDEDVQDASQVITFNEHLEHSYTWTLAEAPTSKQEGTLTGICTCGLEGSTAEVTLPVLNTVDYDYVILEAPSSTKTGKASYTWKNTEYGIWVFEVELPALGIHSTPSVTTPTLPFVDVTGNDWFYSNVLYVYTNGLMSGVDATHFDPYAPMTRAMLWTVLARLDGVSTAGGATWYEKGQTWAMENGVSDGTDPNGCITREQLVTMLWRYAGSPAASDAALDAFTDAASISDWARDAMAWGVENGILNGAGGKLMPAANATRAEVSAILNRYCVNILKKS